ncbi:MAG: TonB-dependent receptor plug domain-containing protein, partial [Bacteroidota bacterium]|nr:TonB-dependent receptor plug domain-containing protein [Bacteroidota bacterium]
MKKIYFSISFLLLFLISGLNISISQPYKISGTVTNSETGDKVFNAVITLEPGTKSANSDNNGFYEIRDVASGDYKIICSYPGLKVTTKNISLFSDLVVDFDLSISFSTETIEINRAKDRETPVAFTDVTKAEIEENIHGQDAPMLAKGTPGLYAYSSDGVGNGESQLLIRGFNQNYVQVLINGIPTNDPESNSVYWSNWGSVSSNAGSIQIQRGAGSSLYGSGGFGGSFNILTDNPIRRFYGATLNLGSPLNTLYGLKLNTGLKNKFSGALNIERKIAEGTRISGRYEGLNYYLSGMYYPNAKQSLKLVLHGAPQEHGYSFSNNIVYFRRFGFKANPAPFLPRGIVATLGTNKTTGQPNYGLLDGSRELVDDNFVNLSENFFHKPQLELHYNIQTNPFSSIKSTFFYTIGRGAGSSMNGTGTLFSLSNNIRNLGVNGMKRDTVVTNFYGPEGFITNDTVANIVYLRQTGGPTVNAYQRISYSLHRQFGLLASYQTAFGKNVDFTGGAEFRSWRADHPGHFVNLFSKDSITAQQYS